MTLYELFDSAQTWMGLHGQADLAWSTQCLFMKHEDLTPDRLLAEVSFAVLASGFRVETIQKRWEQFTEIFLDWKPLKLYEATIKVYPVTPGGVAYRPVDRIKASALRIFNNERKINAILENAMILTKIITDEDDEKWPEFRDSIYEDVDNLKIFHYIGDTLKYHVARNIGVDTIKPDVHLMKIAKHYGYDVFEMAELLSEQFDIPKHTVDTILWRYSERGLTEEFWRGHFSQT